MESIDALQFLKDKTILVTGATGFVGKIFVEKILRIQPNVKKLYLLIRAGDTKSARERMFNEVVEKDLFRVLKDKWGANLESFLLEKVVAVAGDVSDEHLGIKDSELRQEMLKEIDIVVNSAAITSFDARYDVVFGTNTMGAFHVLNFAKECVKIKMLLHVSTAYVCGERSGLIPENRLNNGQTLNGKYNLGITAEKKLVEAKLNQLLEDKDASENVVTSTMKDLGIKRASMYGWPNSYVFTKAMGEMMLGNYRGDLPLVIIRPTMITSTYKEPFPGWLEGLRTIDGPIVGFGKGKLKFLPANLDAIVDLMPADMVINSMIMAMAANAEQSSQIIYQVGSSMGNPITFSNLNEFINRYFTIHPFIDKNGKPIKLGKRTLFKTSTSFHACIEIRYMIQLKVLKLVSIFHKKYKDVCVEFDRKLKFVKRLVKLYKPYMLFKGIFDDTNSEKLRMAIRRESGQEVDAFNFDPKCINWEDYILNTHIPGLVKYVVKG